MFNRSKVGALALILIGVLAGALIFSQFNQTTQPQAHGFSLARSDSGYAADRPINTLRDLNEAFIEIAETVNPTVVTVFTEKIFRIRQRFGGHPFFRSPFEDFFGDYFGRPRRQQPQEREYRQQGLGSGVIVSRDGYVLTNNHVIDGADTVYVRLMDNRTLAAKIIGADPKTDIAVLKIDEKNLPAIELGDSDSLKVGEWVLAVGSPMSANLAHSVTSGIVSAKGRSNVGLAEYEDFIQTDAAINPGNSGGALINLDRKLVGINTAIATRSGGFQGIGFAVPINMARSVMRSLIDHGVVIRGWLGVYIQDIDETMARALELKAHAGVLIADVTDGSPAEKSGLQQGDVILEFDGKSVSRAAQLSTDIAATPPDTRVTLKILRDDKERKIQVTLGRLETTKIAPETEVKLEQLFGFGVAPFDREKAQEYGLDPSLKGVVVTGISQGSSAHRAGLSEGDLIVAINRKRLETMEEFNDLVRNFKRGDTVLFQVMRQNRSFFVAFRL